MKPYLVQPTRRVRPLSTRVVPAMALFALLAGCADAASDVATNQGFDRWCDGGPCGWRVDEGQVSQASTWHSDDYAVEFPAGAQVRISQGQGSSRARCLHFDVVARVNPDARLSVQLDFNEDGWSDWEQAISEVQWKSVPFTIPTPITYSGVRIILLKRGPGSAILAQVLVTDDDDCPDAPLTLRNGSSCQVDAVCESTACVNQRCVEQKPVGSE